MRLKDQASIMHQRPAPVDADNRVPADLCAWQCMSVCGLSQRGTVCFVKLCHNMNYAHLEGNNQVLLCIPLLRATRIERAAGAHSLLQVPSHIPQDATTLRSDTAEMVLLIERVHA